MRTVDVLAALGFGVPVLGDFLDIHGIKGAQDFQAANLRLGHIVDDTAAINASPAPQASVSFQIYTSDTLPSDSALPSACATALTASVACDPTIQFMGADSGLDNVTLAGICTTTCSSALTSYRSTVVNACGKYMIPGANNYTYAPTLAIDSISGPYTIECETDPSTGAYCNNVIANYGNGTFPAQGILGLPTSQLCSACTLGTLNATLSNPLSYSDDVYAIFQSALKQCGSSWTSYNVTPPSMTSLYAPGPSSTPVGTNITNSASCALSGRNVTTTTNVTCSALAAQYTITAFDVLLNNPWLVADNCTNGILPGTQLCLPKTCTLYTPTVNQTCEDVAEAVNAAGTNGAVNITDVQINSFNPALGTGCNAIAAYYGTPICVSPHGGFPGVGSNAGAVPSSTPTATVPPPGPTAPGTTSNCGAWYLVQPGDYCQKVVINNTITLDDFLTLNPEVNSNCTNLWAHYEYCVAPYPPLALSSVTALPTSGTNGSTFTITSLPLNQPTSTTQYVYPSSHLPAPTNVAPGTITYGCDYYWPVQANDTCTSLESTFGIAASDFTFWNANPTTKCPSLVSGTSVCIMVNNATDALPPRPSNAATGSAPNGCAKWYTIISGDNCGTVATVYGLTSAQFLALNPELNAQCTNLGLKQAYCVMAPPSTTTTTTTSTSPTSTPTGPPSNLASGSFTNCTSYHTIVSGDTCNSMETSANISATDLLRWNPEVNVVSCTNIQLGAAYCVGGGGNQCSKRYTVASGDYCSKIETTVGLTDAQLRSYNSWIDSACDLQVGQVLCVGPPSTSTTSTTTTKATTTSPTSTPTGPPSNLASGSFTNCTSYHTVVSGDTCNSMETSASISATDLLRWNPEVNVVTCTNIQLGAAYCVGGGGNQCTKRYTVASGDYCSKIETAVGLTDAQLRSYNPWIDSGCDLQVGQVLCVGPSAAGTTTTTTTTTSKTTSTSPTMSTVPTNLATGSWKNCTTYYNVQSGDNCNVIDTKYTIAFSDFVRWNPSINAGCTNLGLNSYCVKASPACKKIYTVASGDYCSLVESKNSISDSTFRSLNTWLDSNCDLQVTQNLCVG